MKTSTKLVLNVTIASLATIVGNYAVKNARESTANDITLIGAPISASVTHARTQGSLATVLLEKGKPVLAYAYCRENDVCSKAEALLKTKMPGGTFAGNVEVTGLYEDNTLKMRSLKVGDYKVTF